MDPVKLGGLVDWPIPKTVKDVRSFLGSGNYYCRLWGFDPTFERPLEESEHIRMDKRKTDRFRNPEEVSRTTSTAIA